MKQREKPPRANRQLFCLGSAQQDPVTLRIKLMKNIFALVVMLSFVCVGTAHAAPILLSDQNSTFEVNPDSNQGAFSWEVDGTEHLFREWFWYRALFMSRERSIDRTSHLDP